MSVLPGHGSLDFMAARVKFNGRRSNGIVAHFPYDGLNIPLYIGNPERYEFIGRIRTLDVPHRSELACACLCGEFEGRRAAIAAAQ